jgi:hypothetical protein
VTNLSSVLSRGFETTVKSGARPAVARVVVYKLLRHRGGPLLVERPVEGLLSHAPEPPSGWPAGTRRLFGADLLVSLSERGDAWRYAADSEVFDAVHDYAAARGPVFPLRELQRVCDLASMLVLARAGLLLQRQDQLPNVSAAAVEAAQAACDAAEREAEAAAIAKRQRDRELVASGQGFYGPDSDPDGLFGREMTSDEVEALYPGLGASVGRTRADDDSSLLGPDSEARFFTDPPTEG